MNTFISNLSLYMIFIILLIFFTFMKVPMYNMLKLYYQSLLLIYHIQDLNDYDII